MLNVNDHFVRKLPLVKDIETSILDSEHSK